MKDITEIAKEIVLITWDKPIYELAQTVIQDKDRDCGLVYTTQETLEEDARKLERRGTKIFISFGITGKFVRRAVTCPVIALSIEEEDIFQALVQASHIGNRIAVMGFTKTMKLLNRIHPLLNIHLIWKANPPISQMPETIQALTDVDVFIGGCYQAGIAEKYGLKTLVLSPRREAILQAIETARSFLSTDRAEDRSRTRSSIYAIMTVQPDGTLVVLNKVAADYLGIHAMSISPNTVSEVCPQFTKIMDCIENQVPYKNQIAQINGRFFLYHAEPVFRNGLLNYVLVTFQDTDAVAASELAVRRRLAQRENVTTYTLSDIQGSSRCITDTLKLALKYANSQENVLILGDTGTGKELYAQGIHSAGPRSSGPFVAVNCASIPENILESELFGYVKGAFTGASKDGKKGLFEAAHKGTIFLDEIGEIPYSLQGKLLRVLQESQIRRLGDENPIPIDIRVIAATNKNLVELVPQGKFREDLYFRLNVLNLRIPPLCQRENDALLLAEEFLKQASLRQGKNFFFSPEAKEEILRYQWPGNVRELQNMIYRIGVINETDCVGADILRQNMLENAPLYKHKETDMPQPLSLKEALSITGYNKKKTAELLGISRTTLYRMIEKEKIEPPERK